MLWIIRKENHSPQTPSTTAIENTDVIRGGFVDHDEFMEGSRAMQLEDNAFVEEDSLDKPRAEEPIPSE